MALVSDVDVGMRGILRRLGVERRGDAFFRAIRHPLRPQLISWAFIQPLEPKLERLTLSVSREAVSDLHPADIAQIMSDLAPEERQEFFEKLDPETAAEALHELTPEVQADIIAEMDKEQAADIIEQMPPDEAADVIADLPTEKAQELLQLMEKEEAEDIHELLHHEDDTAGGLMTNEYLSYPPGITVGEALERFKREAREIEHVHYVYVVEDERLLGVVDNFGDRRDALHRQRLAHLYIADRVKDLLVERWRASLKPGETPGPEMSILKLHNCRNNIELVHMLTEVLGPRLAADTGEWGTFAWDEYVLSTPGARIGGGTEEIVRNTVGEKVLGLPKEPRV
jgi:DNA-directed RNA polymerase subunit F